MNDVNTTIYSLFGLNRKGRKQDYRGKLWRDPVEGLVEDETTALTASYDRYLVELHRLATPDSLVFQSAVVAAVQTLRRVAEHQRLAARAAISLGQGERLRSMVAATEKTIAVLRGHLTPQGTSMLKLCTDCAPPENEESWWFALSSTIDALEEGVERLVAVVSGQPKGSAGRRLSSLVVRLLRHQHQELLYEADAWIS